MTLLCHLGLLLVHTSIITPLLLPESGWGLLFHP